MLNKRPSVNNHLRCAISPTQLRTRFVGLVIALAVVAPGRNGLAQDASRVDQTQYTEEEILARFAHEPLVQQVQKSAVRYYMVDPDYIQSMRKRAFLKGLVPQISGQFANSLSTTNRVMHDGLYPLFPFKEDEGINSDSRAWNVGVVFTLDRLVFNAEVLDVQSLIGILDGIVREVTTIYYIRRRLQIDMILRPPPDLATRISQRIRVEELTGLLDALTGGFMTRSVREGLEKVRKNQPAAAAWDNTRRTGDDTPAYRPRTVDDVDTFTLRRGGR